VHGFDEIWLRSIDPVKVHSVCMMQPEVYVAEEFMIVK